jgi:hypothetical protein
VLTLLAMFAAAMVLAEMHRRNREWQKYGCPTKILRYNQVMREVIQVRSRARSTCWGPRMHAEGASWCEIHKQLPAQAPGSASLAAHAARLLVQRILLLPRCRRT